MARDPADAKPRQLPASPAQLRVEVAYATPRRQRIVQLMVAAGTTVAEAIEMSALRLQFPEIEAQPTVGIFSDKVELQHVLSAGDRVEIYRPLQADPKEARRRKAEQQQALRKPPRRAG
jgi:putative ubiquitin-RnfH superfamily antitoxin RatB of RatAB toxin-antitoxin module